MKRCHDDAKLAISYFQMLLGRILLQNSFQKITQRLNRWLEIAEAELQQKISSGFESLCGITLLQSSNELHRNELVVTFNHAIADGISALYLMHELLFYYQQLVEGIEIPLTESLPLLPPLEELLKKSLAEPNATDFTQVAPTTQTTPSATLLIEQTAPVADRKTRLIPWELDQTLALPLKSRCRDEQTTVHGALCAAMILAMCSEINI